MDYPPTPELDKMKAVKEQSQVIGEFLDWMRNERGYVFAKYAGDEDELYEAVINVERLLANFFNIDLNKIEAERVIILDWARKQNEQRV